MRRPPLRFYLAIVAGLVIGVFTIPYAVVNKQHSLAAMVACLGLLLSCYALVLGLWHQARGRLAAFLGIVLCGSSVVTIGTLAGGVAGVLQPVKNAARRLAAAAPADEPGDGGASGANPSAPEEEVGRPRESAEHKGRPALPGNLSRLVERLRNGKTRNAAGGELRRLGEKGRPASRVVCELLLATKGAERQGLAETLEAIHPELAKHVLTLIVDGNRFHQDEASRRLAAMGKQAAPAIPVLLHRVNRYWPLDERSPARWDLSSFVSIQDVATLGAVASEGDEDVIRLLSGLAAPDPVTARLYDSTWGVAEAATRAIVQLGKAAPALRARIVKVLVKVMDAEPERPPFREEHVTLAVAGVGEYGKRAAAAIPALKRLKLDPRMRIREAAAASLAKIDAGRSEPSP